MVVSVFFSGAASAKSTRPDRDLNPCRMRRGAECRMRRPEVSERAEKNGAEARLLFIVFNHNNIASEQLIINRGNEFFSAPGRFSG